MTHLYLSSRRVCAGVVNVILERSEVFPDESLCETTSYEASGQPIDGSVLSERHQTDVQLVPQRTKCSHVVAFRTRKGTSFVA